MKTQEFLDKINGAIADAFAPILNTKNQHLGECHDIVGKAIADKLPKEISYSTWFLRPSYESYGISGQSIKLFTLDSTGFSKYRSRKEVMGKWVRPPFYQCNFEGDTLEEIIRLSMLDLMDAKVEEQKERITKLLSDLSNADAYLCELIKKRNSYA